VFQAWALITYKLTAEYHEYVSEKILGIDQILMKLRHTKFCLCLITSFKSTRYPVVYYTHYEWIVKHNWRLLTACGVHETFLDNMKRQRGFPEIDGLLVNFCILPYSASQCLVLWDCHLSLCVCTVLMPVYIKQQLHTGTKFKTALPDHQFWTWFNTQKQAHWHSNNIDRHYWLTAELRICTSVWFTSKFWFH